MADTAHRITDEKLEEMESHLYAVYSRAEKEIQNRNRFLMKEVEYDFIGNGKEGPENDRRIVGK